MKPPIVLAVNVSIFFAYICPLVETEIYTSMEELKQLLFTNKKIFKVLNSYLALENERLRKLRWLRDQYGDIYIKAMRDEESFLTNPVNAFLLVKRLSQDWDHIGYLIEAAPSRALVQNISTGLQFPEEEDLSGAATALLRLQDIYLLETSQMARGNIKGTKSGSELTASDCFQLGYQSIALGEYKRAVQWLQEALVRLEREQIKTASEPLILDFMARCALKLKNVTHAIELTSRIMSIAPLHPGAMENLIHYQNVLKTKGDMFSSEEEYDEHSSSHSATEEEYDKHSSSHSANDEYSSHHSHYKIHHITDDEIDWDYDLHFDNYEKLCRGESIQLHPAHKLLKCRYTTNNNSYLILQPVKQEILSLDPFICIYHDIISNKDVEIFKAISLPELDTAYVVNGNTGLEETAHYRVSKSTWLDNEFHPRLAHASQVIKDITGLDTTTAESLHIVNYGIGGHYEPHYDFARKGEATTFMHDIAGNRIATWIYYLSDVEAGGATVFPKVGVSIQPRKGSAAFWYNLKRNGASDLSTLHAGCPVLSGIKWVGNRWFREFENEFRRKCSLNPWE